MSGYICKVFIHRFVYNFYSINYYCRVLYINNMQKRIFITILVFVALFVSVGYFVYTAWVAHLLVSRPTTEIFLSGERVAENRKRIIRSLTESTGVSMQDALRGFWYKFIDENGIEQVAFLNASDLANRDITQWQIDNISKIVRNSDISERDTMKVVNIADMPDEYQFHNTLYKVEKDGSFIKGKEVLEKRITSGTYTKDDLFKLAYIYELEGKYTLRDEFNDRNCKEFGERCEKTLRILVSGKVVDMDGMPVQLATLSVLSAGNISVQTNKDGIYTIEVPIRKMEKIRVRAHKRNYSDGIANAVAITVGKKKYVMDNIILASPLKIVTIDNKLNTITGDINTYKDGVFTIKTPQSTYSIPTNSIVHKGGSVYNGEMEVYLYEFTRDTAPESLLEVDTMDQVMGYAGDLMKSFGMPYIQFFTPDGEELHVLKSNPMTIQYKIYHMDRLTSGADHIYRPLTELDMQTLVNASRAEGYPIDRKYLIENNMLQFPAFWVFDRTVGVWESIGIKVLTTDGLIESLFYTLNDGRK